MHTARLASTLLKDEEQYEEITLLFVTWPNIRLFNFFHSKTQQRTVLKFVINKPTTP